MRILYISNLRLPTKKAYGINMVKTCEALGKLGVEVVLIAPQSYQKRETVYDYYGIKKDAFSLRLLFSLDAVGRGWRGGYLFDRVFFALTVLLFVYMKQDDVVITRDEFLTGYILRLLGVTVFFDLHGFPEHRKHVWKRALSKMNGIFVTNKWKKEQCKTVFGIEEAKILVVPNGFDPALFGNPKRDKDSLRRELHLPIDKAVVLYSGHLYEWKGAGVLLETARQISKNDNRLLFIFIGGTPWDVEHFKKNALGLENVMILGHRPHEEVPLYLYSADILVLPNSANKGTARMNIFSTYDTAPIKMFEYMASGIPIIASDLPSIREVLNSSNAFFVEPDNPVALAHKISHVLENQDETKEKAAQARKDVQKYTWGKRAGHILHFMKSEQ